MPVLIKVIGMMTFIVMVIAIMEKKISDFCGTVQEHGNSAKPQKKSFFVEQDQACIHICNDDDIISTVYYIQCKEHVHAKLAGVANK